MIKSLGKHTNCSRLPWYKRGRERERKGEGEGAIALWRMRPHRLRIPEEAARGGFGPVHSLAHGGVVMSQARHEIHMSGVLVFRKFTETGLGAGQWQRRTILGNSNICTPGYWRQTDKQTDKCFTIKEICVKIWTLDLKRRITLLDQFEVTVFVLC